MDSNRTRVRNGHRIAKDATGLKSQAPTEALHIRTQTHFGSLYHAQDWNLSTHLGSTPRTGLEPKHSLRLYITHRTGTQALT
mmetsp:Transcript_5433/g.8261  ORF Transcript_5433/g.8261 Transcript_5433/m.8261 type:complete len:82 (+) Transcript_5433:1010-1255(+)